MVFFLLLAFFVSCVISQPDLSANYAFFVNLTPYMTDGIASTGTYFGIYYTVSLTNGTINLAMVAETPVLGYAGFGISDSGNMLVGDVYIGWQDTNGTAYGAEFKTAARGAPSPSVCASSGLATCAFSTINCTDTSLLRGMSRTSWLTVEWTRRLASTSSPCSQAFPADTSLNVIFAVGSVASGSSWPYNIQYHTARTNITYFGGTSFPMTFYSAPIPTTSIPTTAVLTTAIPTTNAPTTAIPTTAIPTTAIPTTAIPTTKIPTTAVPTTGVLTTAIPTTANPTTRIPTTGVPTTRVPTTGIPVQGSTSIPTTAAVVTTGMTSSDRIPPRNLSYWAIPSIIIGFLAITAAAVAAFLQLRGSDSGKSE